MDKIILHPKLIILLSFTLAFIFLQPQKSLSIQDTATISFGQDNTLYYSATGQLSNGQGKYMFSGLGSTGLVRRAVIKFLFSEFLPQCIKVLNVSLKLHLSGGVATNRTIQLRRLNENWGEGSSNAPGLETNGTQATSFDATWIHTYYNTDFWTTPGGTYSGIPSASTVVGGPAYYQWGSTPEMVRDVQDWVDNQSINFGWLLLGNETINNSAKRFHTGEADTSEFIPEITVIYQTPMFSLYMESIIEGFWKGTSMVEDTLKVKLRNTFSPYAVADSDAAVCSQYGGNFCFHNASPGDYYISVNHRNSIETWSKFPVTFSLNGFEYYDFSDAITKAYGDNEIFKLGEYCFFSGDVNQNGNVDVIDQGLADNDALNFVTGYVNTDVNGDDVVDANDLSIIDNNAYNFVGKVTPP